MREEWIMAEPLLLTPEATAEMLSCSRSTVYELIAAGELMSLKIGRSRRVPADAARQYVERLMAEKVA
jgi:excisionase family DNA binding protein